MNRRDFLSATVAAAGFALASGSSLLSRKERVDRALLGQDVDRPPYTFYHHYARPTAQLEAQDHLDFHRTYNTDIVKVMNDFDYPKSTNGKWFDLKPLDSPYPNQLAFESHVWLDEKVDAGRRQTLGQRLPRPHLQHHAEVGDRHVVTIDGLWASATVLSGSRWATI
jgi:hypothetical protein